MGMLNITAQLFLEVGDEGYDKYVAEHYVTIPIVPESGYQGKVNEAGEPIDQSDYDKWIASLPIIKQLNPFCTHSIQFEHDVTAEEILWCFEFALGITHRNYLADDLHCKKGGQVVNQNIHYLSRKAFYEGVSLIPENNRTDYMKAEMGKAGAAKNKIAALSKIDFTKVKTIGIYSVK